MAVAAQPAENAPSLPSLLSSITESTTSALTSLASDSTSTPPLTTPETESAGISLLTTKNELFLAYLQTLALRNLQIVRALRRSSSAAEFEGTLAAFEPDDAVTRQLAELRVYLERGVRPLEGKIAYQLDKVVRAAVDEEEGGKRKKGDGKVLRNGDVSSEDEEDDDEEGNETTAIASSAHRANPANFGFSGPNDDTRANKSTRQPRDALYRPPRISATSMPARPTPNNTTSTASEQRQSRRAARSATLDEYIATELSTAPRAEPSIGSTITQHGRREADARQLARERERREYEETNLLRLPKEAKTAADRRRERMGRGGAGGFGGEEWRGLGESVDRIADLTKRKGGREGALAKSRKRKETADRARGDGLGEGVAFEGRKRRVLGRRK